MSSPSTAARADEPPPPVPERVYHQLVQSVHVTDRLPPGDSSRYFSVVEVPEHFEPALPGELWVFARRSSRPHGAIASTSAVWARATAGSLLGGAPPHTFVRDHSTAHNFAPLFHGRSFIGAGGEFWATPPPKYNVSELGRPTGVRVRRAERRAQVVGADASFGGLPLVSHVRGDAPGCFEARRLPRLYNMRRDRLACEFDGLLSLAPHRGGLLLFARANTSPVVDMGRHVQVARAPSAPLAPGAPGRVAWSRFVLLDFEGHAPEQHNVYYGSVAPNPADRGRTLLALVPASIGGGRVRPACMIGLAVSCDGVAFSRLEPLVTTPCANGGRTVDQPVSGWVVRGASAHAWVHADVPGLSTPWHNSSAATDSRLVRLSIPLAALAEHTRRTLATSAALRRTCDAERPAEAPWAQPTAADTPAEGVKMTKLPAHLQRISPKDAKWLQAMSMRSAKRPRTRSKAYRRPLSSVFGGMLSG